MQRRRVCSVGTGAASSAARGAQGAEAMVAKMAFLTDTRNPDLSCRNALAPFDFGNRRHLADVYGKWTTAGPRRGRAYSAADDIHSCRRMHDARVVMARALRHE